MKEEIARFVCIVAVGIFVQACKMSGTFQVS